MKSKDVFHHFGTQASAAVALGMAQSGVASWGEYPPEARQLLIERITLGALKAEPGCFERLIGLDQVPENRPTPSTHRPPAAITSNAAQA